MQYQKMYIFLVALNLINILFKIITLTKQLTKTFKI